MKSPYYTPCLSVWFDFYKEKTGEKYLMDAKSGNHLKQLIKKIEFKLKDRSMEPSEENITNSMRHLLASIGDKWILENLELAIVNSKFNVIYSKATATSPFGVRESVEEYLRVKNSQRAI